MKRKPILPAALLALFLSATAVAQDVKVEFFTPSIVHIVKGQPTKTLVVTAEPEPIEVKHRGN
ncbi:MAG: hypothetical protein IKS80_01410, partial [Bacteroidaceae bacterium]|nr:hypothetical protein [Bacteroidaceae bacterium]